MTQMQSRFSTTCQAQERIVPESSLGELRDSADLTGKPKDLAGRLDDEGYLFIRNGIDPAVTASARHNVFLQLANVDEVEDPDGDTRATGRSNRLKLRPDKGAFWKSVSEQPAMRAVTHGRQLTALLSDIFGEAARPFDFVFLRPGINGRFTNIHCDKPFFSRTTDRVLTCWIALGPVPVERGPLFIVEGSHQWPDVRQSVDGYDVARDKDRMNSVTQHPADLATERNTRLLTADFAPGDLIIFGMYLLHGAFDNHATDNRLRLSCDVRFQPEADPVDPRYFGDDPGGTTGGGYGELNGAKPLTADWHQR